MASNYLHSSLVRGGGGGGGGASKARAALAKIIAVISTVPPPPPPPPPLNLNSNTFVNGDGDPEEAAVDLSLRLCGQIVRGECGGQGGTLVDPVVTADSVGLSNDPTVEDDSISPAESDHTAGRSSEGECYPVKIDEEERKDEGGNEKSEITTNLEVAEEEEEEEEEERGINGGSHQGYLDLLLEAVRRASEEVQKEEEEEELEEYSRINNNKKRLRSPSPLPSKMKSWMPFEFYEDTAPVVRSNRGRNQALPSRYRDSVLEPWAKPPTVSRHGRTTTRP